MTNTLNYRILAQILLVITLGVWVGCGSDEDPLLKDDTSVDDLPLVLNGTLNGQVQTIEAVEIRIDVLQNGRIITSTEADADGNYRIDNIKAGAYTVQIVAKGYQATNLHVQIIADQTTLLDEVALEAVGFAVAHIRGFLSDRQTKKALGNVRIQLVEGVGHLRETVTTAVGGFEFENVPANQSFTLVIDHDKYEKQEVVIDPIPEAETAKVTIELMPILEEEVLPIGQGLTVGTQAPDFSLPDHDGNVRSLANYAGRRVVLVFDRGRW